MAQATKRDRFIGEGEERRLNSKYAQFFLIRNGKGGRRVQVGGPHSTIGAALAAAKRRDERDPRRFTFVDVVGV